MSSEHAKGKAQDQVSETAQDICEHMNQDHADAVLLLCSHFGCVEAEVARMVDVSPLGFEILAVAEGQERSVWIDFPVRVATPDEVRLALIRMLREARGQ